jgi:chromatin remodeling complex protein RSC6
MVRVSKSSASTVTAPVPISVPVPVPVHVEEEIVSKKTKKASQPPKVVVDVVVSKPVIENEVLPPLSEKLVVDVEVDSNVNAKVVTDAVLETPSVLSSKFLEFGTKLQQTISLLTTLKSEYKGLAKIIEKNQRLAQKKILQKRKASGNRQPSGFVKPTRITDELANFLGKSHGTLIARTQVSREINEYIRANSLQDKTNGREIIPDEKLSTLLNLSPEDKLTYFNLQKYMKHHFIKETPAPAVLPVV